MCMSSVVLQKCQMCYRNILGWSRDFSAALCFIMPHNTCPVHHNTTGSLSVSQNPTLLPSPPESRGTGECVESYRVHLWGSTACLLFCLPPCTQDRVSLSISLFIVSIAAAWPALGCQWALVLCSPGPELTNSLVVRGCSWTLQAQQGAAGCQKSGSLMGSNTLVGSSRAKHPPIAPLAGGHTVKCFHGDTVALQFRGSKCWPPLY